MKYIPTAESFFSGAGGLDYGIADAGINILQSLEIDSICCQTLRHNFNHKVVQADITEQLVADSAETDIIMGTYPCTKYSPIASISGTRTGDELYLHFFRQVAIKQPECYIVENVPGMKKFKVVMEAMTKLPGYFINMFCPLDASIWLPQKRARLILIGTKKHFPIQAPANCRRLTLADILEADPEIEIPDYFYSRIDGKYRDKPIVSDPANGGIAPTCVAHYAKDCSTRAVKDSRFKAGIRPYTPLEFARLQGFPDTFKFAGSDKDIYKQVGNAVAVPMGYWIGKEVMKYFNRSTAA